jgi:hypothetical protein
MQFSNKSFYIEGFFVLAMAKDEEVGFHKGAITTLLKERQQLVQMIQIVDALLKAHSEALQKLGVKLGGPSGPSPPPKPSKKKR